MLYMLSTHGLYGLSLRVSGVAVRWHYPATDCPEGGIAVGVDGTVYAACVGIAALNGATGAVVWPTVLPGVTLTGVTIGPNDMLFVGDSVRRLHAIV
jgi:outer membrane protein assembly factor BamB